MSNSRAIPAHWHRWKQQEPLVDFMCVSDTEVAEYRAWAGTKGWHDRTVEELIALTEKAQT